MRRAALRLARQSRNFWRLQADYARLRWQLRFGPAQDAPGLPPLAIILQSYARPKNMELIIRTALKCRFVGQVILSNNNPELDLSHLHNLGDSRLVLLHQDRKMPCGTRYDLASTLPFHYFMSIDDDVFLTPRQISSLFAALIENPAVPHGLFGQIWRKVEVGSRQRWMLKGVPLRHEGPVDVLNCVVAFTSEHAESYREVLRRIGKSGSEDLGPADDIVVSASGSNRPLCHSVGRILTCASTDDPQIAAFLQPGVRSYRENIFRQVHAICSSPSPEPQNRVFEA
jgi:hypothetical protein